MTINKDEFFQNLDAENITPEQAAQMIEFGLEGDTDVPASTPETESDAPDALADADGNPSEQVQEHQADKDTQPNEGAATDAEPVLMAKDGRHTIPYQQLVDAREGEQRWKAEAEAAKATLEQLQAKASADAGEDLSTHEQNAAIAQEAVDSGIDPDLFGDFSEEDLAKGVMKLVEQKLAEIQLQQTQQQTQESATDAHFKMIYDAHPDADSIIESQELAQWIDSQPSHTKLGIQTVLQRGNAQDVIGVFNDFKKSTGETQPEPSQDDVKAKARQVASSVTSEPPVSLSAIPGAKPEGTSLAEQMANMEGIDLVQRMADMTPDQINDLLNRTL